MSQGPSSIQLSIKENQMEGDKGPDSQPCVKRSVKKAAIVFETDLRKGRQWRSLNSLNSLATILAYALSVELFQNGLVL